MSPGIPARLAAALGLLAALASAAPALADRPVDDAVREALARLATHPGDDALDATPTAETPPSAPKSGDPWDINVPHSDGDSLKFETSEGTWMSVDVSPDGRTLLFDILGDLYTMPIEGGRATRLTSGMALDMQARWSPDGRKIAFTTDRSGTENVWMMNADGTGMRPVSQESDRFSNSPAWSPDGHWIVCRRRLTDRSSLGTVELWMYSVLGGKGVQVTKKAEWGDANEPLFSRDGRYVYFTGRPTRFAYDRNVHAGIWDIRRFDRVTGKIVTVTDGAGGAGRAAFSPDGKTFSFIRREREKTVLMLQDVESGRERLLYDGLSMDNMEGFAWTGVYPNYAWTPDGRSIVIYAGGGFLRVDVATGRAARIPFTARVEQFITHAVRFPQSMGGDQVRIRQVAWPSLSPDGRSIAFSAIGRVWRWDLATKTATALTPADGRAFAPAWSPDGRTLAYVTWHDRDGGAVMTIPATGGSSTRVTRVPAQYLNPAWSPDGRRLAFLKGSGGVLNEDANMNDELWYELQWMPVAGGDAQTVTTLDAQGDAPSMPRPVWNMAGDRLYYVEYGGDPSGAAQKNTLVSIRLDGTDRIEHANITNAEGLVPSPDEKWVAYRVKYAAYVSELPKSGRDPVDLGTDGGALPARKLADDSGDWLGWGAGGHAITWSSGPSFYRLSLDSLTAFWERSLLEAGKPKVAKTTDAGDAGKRPGGDSTGTAKAGPDSSAVTKADAVKPGKAEPKAPKPDSIEIVLRVPRARPSGTVAFTNARVLTEKGGDADAVIEGATVVVTNDRITAVGPGASVAIPAGAKVFDARGKTIVPGFVDVHAHQHYADAGVVPNHFWADDALLAYGVTTTHDPSATSWEVFTEAEMIETGALRGPRTYSTGNILYGAGGRDALPLKDLDDARHQLRRLKRMGAISVKDYMQPRREQRQWILQAAREESLLVVPEGGGKFEEDLTHIADGHTGLEHALPITPIYRDVVELFSRSRAGYTPTLLVAYGGLSGENWFYQHYDVFDDAKLRRFTPEKYLAPRAIRRPVMAPDWDWHHIDVAKGAKQVVEAGGHVQIGAHGQRQGLGDHWEMWGLAQGGMRPADVIKCATWNGAWYLGMDGSIGSIEPGKLADFVVLDKNPLEDIHNTNTIRWTVKNGEVYDGDTLERK
jgi:Tol biopolymer transport system component/imidazolonepropionase-like amidohydrolase